MPHRRLKLWRSALSPATRVGLLIALSCASAAAHDRTNSYSTWEINGTSAKVVARMWEIDTTHFEWAAVPGPERDRRLGEHLANQLRLSADGKPCSVSQTPRAVHPGSGRVAFEWSVNCPSAEHLQLRSDLLLDIVPSHLHFARVRQNGGSEHEKVLSNRDRTWDLDTTSTAGAKLQPAGTSLAGYVQLGIEHILGGYDHLAFVLALLLIGGSFSEIAKVVTGFTVAHSVTLGLAVLGYVHPATAPIEALIGLSIALVATENIWLLGGRGRTVPAAVTLLLIGLALAAWRGHGAVPALTLAGLALFVACYFRLLREVSQVSSLRWCIAFIFGLVHGFGFAAVLGEAGLPPDRVLAALFGFNIGVEIGQLGVVALIWPTLRWLTRGHEGRYRLLVDVGSSAIAALGVFWFVSRAFG